MAKLQGLTEGKITGNPAKAIEVLSNKLGIREGEQGGVLQSLIEGERLRPCGRVRGMGGQLIELNRDQWREVLEAA